MSLPKAPHLKHPRHVMRLAVSQHRGKGVVGLVVNHKPRRNKAGPIVMECGFSWPGPPTTQLLKLGITQALKIAVTEGYTAVEVGCADTIMRSLKKMHINRVEATDTHMQTILRLARQIETTYFRWVPRSHTRYVRQIAQNLSGARPRPRTPPEPMALWEIGIEQEMQRLMEAEDQAAESSDAWRDHSDLFKENDETTVFEAADDPHDLQANRNEARPEDFDIPF